MIASAILGGTSTLGGVGTIPGAMIGGLIMASLSTGLQMLNAPPATTYVVKGVVLVLAVLLDVYFKKTSSKALSQASAVNLKSNGGPRNFSCPPFSLFIVIDHCSLLYGRLSNRNP